MCSIIKRILYFDPCELCDVCISCVGIGAASPLPADGHGHQPGGGAAADGGSGRLLRHLYEWGRARRDPGAHQVYQVGGFLTILQMPLWQKKNKKTNKQTHKQRKVQLK